jgi:hypothetical protein
MKTAVSASVTGNLEHDGPIGPECNGSNHQGCTKFVMKEIVSSQAPKVMYDRSFSFLI